MEPFGPQLCRERWFFLPMQLHTVQPGVPAYCHNGVDTSIYEYPYSPRPGWQL
jgi:hypothetical protein